MAGAGYLLPILLEKALEESEGKMKATGSFDKKFSVFDAKIKRRKNRFQSWTRWIVMNTWSVIDQESNRYRRSNADSVTGPIRNPLTELRRGHLRRALSGVEPV